jgi:uncharacterized protein with GYD domain
MKLLILGSYNSDGAKGVIKEGASGRKAAIEKALQGMGGKLDGLYYAYGDVDVYVLVDVPDAVSGLALSLVVNASGVVKAKTVPLFTVDEVDAACKKTVSYRGAGQS